MNSLKTNLIAGLRLALFLRVTPQTFRISVDQAVVLSLFGLALGILTDYFSGSGPMRFSWYGFSFYGFYLTLFLFASYVIGKLTARSILLETLVYASASAPLFYLLTMATLPFYKNEAFAWYGYYAEWAVFGWGSWCSTLACA